MRTDPLPTTLTGHSFAVKTAVDSGVTLNRLNASDLDASVWGVRDTDRRQLLQLRCARFAARLGDHVLFSHSTAALLYNLPLPLALETQRPLHVSVCAPLRAPHARGLIGHSLTFGAGEIAWRNSLRVTSPERTWCDLASQLGLLNLVAAGDALLNRTLPLTSADRLAACIDRHPLLKHIARAREALPLLDARAESRPESMVRVLSRRGGLPHPKINHSLIDTENGTVVRPDFEFTEYKTLLEYQGDYHRLTKAQWRKDMTRRSRLQAAGWVVIEMNADDLRDPDELVRRIAATLTRQG